MKRFTIGVAAASLLLLGACAGNPSTGEGSSKFDDVGSVEVEGAFGEVPTLTFDGKPSSDLQRTVVSSGDGRAIKDDSLIIGDYAGYVFDGDQFDTSFDETEPIAFNQGAAQVIPGWEKTLSGVKEGSRVVISVPSEDGYGEQGAEAIGIGPDDTLVFVIDVLAVIEPSDSGQADAEVTDPAPAGVTITGELGQPATLVIDEGAALPTADSLTVLAKGTGEPLREGTAVVQFASSNWNKSESESTWGELGPQPVTVGNTSTALDSLVGVPVGSRVVLILAPYAEDVDPAATSVVVVMDILGQPMGSDVVSEVTDPATAPSTDVMPIPDPSAP